MEIGKVNFPCIHGEDKKNKKIIKYLCLWLNVLVFVYICDETNRNVCVNRECVMYDGCVCGMSPAGFCNFAQFGCLSLVNIFFSWKLNGWADHEAQMHRLGIIYSYIAKRNVLKSPENYYCFVRPLKIITTFDCENNKIVLFSHTTTNYSSYILD